MHTEVEKDSDLLLSNVFPFFSELCDDCPVLLSIISDELIREIEELESLNDGFDRDLDVFLCRVWCDLYMKDKLPADEWNVSFKREVRDADTGEVIVGCGVRRVVVPSETKCPGLALDKDN